MDKQTKASRKRRILQAIYSSSWGISTTALALVVALEIFMLSYSVVQPGLYGPFLWKYRGFYLMLLAVAAAGVALNLYVRQDLERRYRVLNVANPLFAVLFFAWALIVTWSDWTVNHAVDATVFMTFSMVVPLSFYLFPAVYAIIVAAADALMLLMVAQVPGAVGQLINVSIFFVFQLVLGISFLRLKTVLAKRIVQEQDNADIDVMTGFGNRRAYEAEVKRLAGEEAREDLIYLAVDLNGLKEVNDSHGHETGDGLIVGEAECINQCFGSQSRKFRIGGDEFVVLLHGSEQELLQRLAAFEQRMVDWSARNEAPLSASYGWVRQSEFPEQGVAELAKLADERMYAAKARYYQSRGKDRRKSAQA